MGTYFELFLTSKTVNPNKTIRQSYRYKITVSDFLLLNSDVMGLVSLIMNILKMLKTMEAFISFLCRK